MDFDNLDFGNKDGSAPSPQTKRDPAGSASISTLRRVRLAIASRVLETAGASLVLNAGGNPTGFVLRIPRRVGVPTE